MSSTRKLACWISILLALTITGCGEPRPFDSVIVYGRITFNGKPISNGEIRFVPQSGTKGPVAGAPVKDGNYKVISKGGVPVGEHTVRIEAFETNRLVDDSIPAEVAEDFGRDLEQMLPPQFNTRSTLRAKVNSEVNRQRIDFDLIPSN